MRNIIYIVLFIYAVLAGLTIYFFNGTGDSGDSVQHYLYGKYAPVHPELFLNHWAKPLYVLLTCPFSQFGFAGAKIFNVIASLITIFLTYKTAQELNLKNAIICAVILIFSPLYYILTFSGLTEPLFALFISIGLYASIKHKYITAALVISFLPFIRSEGLIIIGVFALYLLLKRKWKLLPFLLTGHFVYSIAGFFVHHDLFWVFNKIPYANMSSPYGHGELSHFAVQLIYVIGVPLYILFGLGIASILWRSVKKNITLELQILVFLGFISFFIAHSLFWYFGIFNSMGLKRVMIGVMPMIAIIALQGFNLITEEFLEKKKNLKLIFQGLLSAYIIIFPFTSNPAAINWERDMTLSKDQQAAVKTTGFIIHNKGANHRFIFAHPYISEILNIDCFDKSKKLNIDNNSINQIKEGDIIIWENWFAVVESGITKEQLDNNPKLVNLFHLTANDDRREIIYSVYEQK